MLKLWCPNILPYLTQLFNYCLRIKVSINSENQTAIVNSLPKHIYSDYWFSFVACTIYTALQSGYRKAHIWFWICNGKSLRWHIKNMIFMCQVTISKLIRRFQTWYRPTCRILTNIILLECVASSKMTLKKVCASGVHFGTVIFCNLCLLSLNQPSYIRARVQFPAICRDVVSVPRGIACYFIVNVSTVYISYVRVIYTFLYGPQKMKSWALYWTALIWIESDK